jgi:OOP family OmpA-OmpF porin
MKITKLLSPCIVLGALATPNLTMAEEPPWNLNLLGSYLNPDDDRQFITGDADVGVAAALGYRFTPQWEGRLIYNQWDFDDSAKGYGVDALYHFNDKQFYGIGGVKRADFDRSAEDMVNLGLGKRFNLTEQLYATAEVMVNQSLERNHTDMAANFGITYMFGTISSTPRAKPAPVVEPQPAKHPAKPQAKDSDGDGVMDAADKCPNTPRSDAVNPQGCTRYRTTEDSIRLSINFANNSDVVEQSYHGEIAGVAKFMKKYPDTTVVIEGHTSAKGGAVYNQELSERRAKMVAKILVKQYNIDQSRVTHVGYGEERLLNNDNTKAADQQNRRIEARIRASKKINLQRY